MSSGDLSKIPENGVMLQRIGRSSLTAALSKLQRGTEATSHSFLPYMCI